jgi:hypothetical protein
VLRWSLDSNVSTTIGSSLSERERWPAEGRAAWHNPYQFLNGLFFPESGLYRVIVFILQDLPFVQSAKRITREDALAWFKSGANILPPEIAARDFDGHCTVLIYEFASDGSTVRVVDSRLTAKQHLEKAGVLPFLEKVN